MKVPLSPSGDYAILYKIFGVEVEGVHTAFFFKKGNWDTFQYMMKRVYDDRGTIVFDQQNPYVPFPCDASAPDIRDLVLFEGEGWRMKLEKGDNDEWVRIFRRDEDDFHAAK